MNSPIAPDTMCVVNAYSWNRGVDEVFTRFTIYVTHGHGDHFFGIGALLERFPNARAVDTADVVKLVLQQASPEFVGNFWSAW